MNVFLMLLFYSVSCHYSNAFRVTSSNLYFALCGLKYETELNMDCEQTIRFFPNGEFIYNYTGCTSLATPCNTQKGRWKITGDTLILNTYYQDRLDDYFKEEGHICIDSIGVSVFSMNTLRPTDDFVYIDDDIGFFVPDSKGCILLPCTKKECLETLIRTELIHIMDSIGNFKMECGKKYRYYLKDCYQTVMKNERFVILDSVIINCKNGTVYYFNSEYDD